MITSHFINNYIINEIITNPDSHCYANACLVLLRHEDKLNYDIPFNLGSLPMGSEE